MNTASQPTTTKQVEAECTMVTPLLVLAWTLILFCSACMSGKPAADPASTPIVQSAEVSPPTAPSAIASPPSPVRAANVQSDSSEEEPDPVAGVTPKTLGPFEAKILVEALPLQMSDIDFTRIRQFLDLYVAIVAGEPSERRASVVAAIKQTRIYMREATQLTNSQMVSFPVDSLTANDIIAWARPPRSGSAVPLADALELIVQQVSQVIADFRKYADFDRSTMLRFDEQRLTTIEQQSGGRHIPYGSSVTNSNIENIRAARARLPQVLQNR